ncbi:MAG: peptidoglycan DD-metalloendopeptidase family protein [Candidatus Margulisiibacteriota bacterium]
MKYRILFIIVIISGIQLQAVDVFFENASTIQGGAITAWIKDNGDLIDHKLFYRGKYYPVFPAGKNTWRAIIGTDVNTPPKTYPVFYKGIKNNSLIGGTIELISIIKGKFPLSVIQIPTSKKSLAEPSQIMSEAAIIGSIFKGVTSQQYWEGKFQWPVKGSVTTPYGAARIYDNGELSWWHKGVDIYNIEGTPVVAPNSGQVVLSKDFSSHGKTIILDHGQTVYSVFNHLSQRLVNTGDFVQTGQIIGKLGSTGIATGPHLHWGLSVGNVRVNPLLWLQ